jgi:hypothetical protein
MTKEDLRAVVDLIADVTDKLKDAHETKLQDFRRSADEHFKVIQQQSNDECGKLEALLRESREGLRYWQNKAERAEERLHKASNIQTGQTYCGCWSGGGRCNLPHGHTGPHA